VDKEYRPGKGDAKAAFGEKLQNGLKDYWRDMFAARFAKVEHMARAGGGVASEK
jgi:hypothetical protein